MNLPYPFVLGTNGLQADVRAKERRRKREEARALRLQEKLNQVEKVTSAMLYTNHIFTFPSSFLSFFRCLRFGSGNLGS